MTEMEKSVAIVKEQYARFFRGDVEGFFKALAPDVELYEPETLLSETWDQISMDIDEYLTGDRTVIAFGVFRATSRRSGRQVAVAFAEAWQVRDGLVTMVKPLYSDTALMLQAISA